MSTMTTMTGIHHADTCQCFMCRWARAGYAATPDPVTQADGECAAHQKRAQLRRLLEVADPSDPVSDGVLQLAEANLQDEGWYQNQPTNAMQDEWVAELARRVQTTVDDYLRDVSKRFERREEGR